MYLHVPIVTFVMNPNTSASCIRFLQNMYVRYFTSAFHFNLDRATKKHETHENKTLLVLSCGFPSSQKTAGYVSRTKKKGKRGKNRERENGERRRSEREERKRKKEGTHWRVYGPLSIEHLGSELGVILLKINFACCLCSCNSCSVCSSPSPSQPNIVCNGKWLKSLCFF